MSPLFILSTNVLAQFLGLRSDAEIWEFRLIRPLTVIVTKPLSFGPPGTPASPRINENPIISFSTPAKAEVFSPDQ